jgi:hypothetical protein
MQGAEAIVSKRNIRRTGIPATKRGRPRKTNVVRDASGKSRGEIVDFSVVLNQPHRRDAKGDARKSELLGYPLGRLRLGDQISELQHRTGNEWALLVRSYAGTFGLPFGSPRSGSDVGGVAAPAYAFSADDARHDAEEHRKRVLALRSRYDGCFERLLSLGRSLGRGTTFLVVMRQVCVEERYPNDRELGDIRLGLNALAHELGIK